MDKAVNRAPLNYIVTFDSLCFLLEKGLLASSPDSPGFEKYMTMARDIRDVRRKYNVALKEDAIVDISKETDDLVPRFTQEDVNKLEERDVQTGLRFVRRDYREFATKKLHTLVVEKDCELFKTFSPFVKIHLYDFYTESDEKERDEIWEMVESTIKYLGLMSILTDGAKKLSASVLMDTISQTKGPVDQNDVVASVMRQMTTGDKVGDFMKLTADIMKDEEAINSMIDNAGVLMGVNFGKILDPKAIKKMVKKSKKGGHAPADMQQVMDKMRDMNFSFDPKNGIHFGSEMTSNLEKMLAEKKDASDSSDSESSESDSSDSNDLD